MSQPVSEPTSDTWLVDPGSPLLDRSALARIEDPARPDRLAWNAFRTLALWDADSWVPSLLESACGPDNPLSPLEWSGAKVVPWGAAGLDFDDVTDVVIDGPAAYVVMACTLRQDPTEQHVLAGMVAALEGSLHGGRQAGLVLVAPPGTGDAQSLLAHASQLRLMDGHSVADFLEGALGWTSWTDIARLALDLAEKPDTGPAEAVRQLVGEIQGRFPDPVV